MDRELGIGDGQLTRVEAHRVLAFPVLDDDGVAARGELPGQYRRVLGDATLEWMGGADHRDAHGR